MQIDPKVSMWIMIATAVMGVIAASGAQLTELFGTGVAQKIVTVDGLTLAIVGAVAGVLHGYSAPTAGPLVNTPPSSAPPKAMVFLALAVGGALLLAGGAAHAQTQRAARPAAAQQAPVFCDPLKLIPGCTQQQVEDADNLSPAVVWKRIAAVALPDLTYAKALADSAAISNPGGGGSGRSQCLAAIIDLNRQTSGGNVPKNPDGTPMAFPDPHIISGVEMAAEIVDELGPNSPVMSKCAAAAQALRMNTLAFVNAIVTGAVSFTALGAGVP